MKDVVGSPGTRSGLALRVSQCLFAIASLGTMIAAYGFANYSAFCYLAFIMFMEILWSFMLACIDIHSLKTNWDLHTKGNIWKYFWGDWFFAISSSAAASAAAGLAILFERDVHFCRVYPYLSCNLYNVSAILAFISWSFMAASAGSTFWLLVALSE